MGILTDEQGAYLEWLQETTNECRGRFANYAIMVEQVIGEFIARYFVVDDEKGEHFRQLVLGEVNFGRKMHIFIEIMNNFLPPTFDAYKSLIPTIDHLRRERNLIVHSKADNTVESITANCQERDKIRILRLDNYKLKQVALDISTIENDLSEYRELVEKLHNMLDEYSAFTEARSLEQLACE